MIKKRKSGISKILGFSEMEIGSAADAACFVGAV